MGGAGIKKVHYGLCERSEYATSKIRRKLGRVKFRKDLWDCYWSQGRQGKNWPIADLSVTSPDGK